MPDDPKRQPGYHNRRWYRNHPEAARPASTKSAISGAPVPSELTKSSMQQLAWSWPVVGGALFFIWGGALGFMTSSHPNLADAFFVVGALLFIGKFVSWEDTKKHTRRALITVVVSVSIVLMTIGAIWGNHHINAVSIPAPPNVPASPLEVVAFDANIKAMISNHSDKPIFVMDMQIAAEMETNLITLALEVPPHEVQTAHLSVGQSKHGFHSMDRLSPVWKEHVQKTVQLYGGPCVAFDYFSPNDPDLLMMKEHYAKEGGILPLADAKGILHYRVEGTDETKSQPVDLIVTTFVKNECKAKR